MNRNKMLLSAAFFAITGATYSMQAQQIKVESRGDTTLLRIANPPKSLLSGKLPNGRKIHPEAL